MSTGTFSRISIPLVRRMSPPLYANDIVSVQPLTTPAALDYYLRYRYSEAHDRLYDWDERLRPPKVNWKKEGF